MTRLQTRFALACASLAFGVNSAGAASPDIAAAVAARQANYKEIGGDFKSINDEMKNSPPDPAIIKPLAKELLRRASDQLQHFPAGSGPLSGIKTRAKAEIWNDNASFRQLMSDLLASATTLQQAAEAGDLSAIAAARSKVGAACKSCHDKFREPED